MGNIITFSTALFTIIDPGAIDAADVGLVITYALSVTQTLNWLVSTLTHIFYGLLDVLVPVKCESTDGHVRKCPFNQQIRILYITKFSLLLYRRSE